MQLPNSQHQFFASKSTVFQQAILDPGQTWHDFNCQVAENLVFRHQGYLKTRGNMGQIMSTLITGDLKQKKKAKLLPVPLERVAPESVPANHDCERRVRYKRGWRNTLSCTIGAGLGSWNVKMLWPDLPQVCCCSKATRVLYIYNRFSYFAHGYTTTMLLIQDSR